MSNKPKTSLKDVSSFLKQQPSTLVQVKKPVQADPPVPADTLAGLVETIRRLAGELGKSETDILLELSEALLEQVDDPSPSDILHLTTVIYLRHSKSLGG